MGNVIDGRAVAREVRKQLKEEIEGLKRSRGVIPGLAVVLVGDDPASHLYVRNKKKACQEVGIHVKENLLPEQILAEALLALVRELNEDPTVHGILVQLPLHNTFQRGKLSMPFPSRRMWMGFIP